MKPEILFLKQEDVIAAGVMDMKKILELVEKAYYMDGIGEINNPAKTEVYMPDETNWQSVCISMPVYIGGDVNRVGVKWAAESTSNMKTNELPMGIDMVILSDPKTVLPVAIMDGLVITAMRTGAAAGVAAKYLAPKNAEVVACVGAGIIGRTMIMALSEVLPNLKQVRLCDLNLEKAKNLASEFDGKIQVIPTDSVCDAVCDADVIATMTTSRKPFVKSEWVKSNAMVIQMSSYEYEKQVAKRANKLVVDNWIQMKKNAASSLSQMYKDGELDEKDIILLKEIVSGKKQSRQSEDELTMFSSRGIGCLDIMVGNYIYEQAKKKGLGQKLVLWDEVKWV